MRVSKSDRGKSVTFRALVDTGATSTTVPRATLESLGVQPSRSVRVRLADGRRVPRDVGLAFVRCGKHATPTWILFGEPEDATVLGGAHARGIVAPGRPPVPPASRSGGSPD